MIPHIYYMLLRAKKKKMMMMKIYFFATSEIEYKVNVNPYNDVEMIHDFCEIMK